MQADLELWNRKFEKAFLKHFPIAAYEGRMSREIVVLSGQSLFVEGLISRLREYPKRLEVHHIDPNNADYIDQIGHIQPAAVLIDAANTGSAQCGLLCELLRSCPSVLVVRLAVDQRDVQIIRSSTHQFSGVQELIGVLEHQPQ